MHPTIAQEFSHQRLTALQREADEARLAALVPHRTATRSAGVVAILSVIRAAIGARPTTTATPSATTGAPLILAATAAARAGGVTPDPNEAASTPASAPMGVQRAVPARPSPSL